MKKYGFILIMLLSFCLCTSVNAQDIQNISMDINIDKSGTAHVKETWTYFDDNEDITEIYKPYYNIGESKFTNFTVSLNNQTFTNIDWDVNKDFNYKAYKNGINYINNGVELCWGLSEKGKTNTYNISYDITNFVAKLTDADMVYWTLIPHNLADSPENIHIKIYSDFMTYSDSLDVWGFGKYGAPTYVYNGYIEMSTDEILKKDEHMTILIKYPKDTFNNTNSIDKNFDHYLKMAQNGATSYKNNTSIKDKILNLFGVIIDNFPAVIIIVISIIAVIKGKNNITAKKKIKFRKEEKKLPKEVNYIREIPCNKSIYRAYWFSKMYKLNKKDTDLLGAVLLKWLNEGKIQIRKEMSTGLFKKEKSSIALSPSVTFENFAEQNLYQMLIDASEDYILEANEFKKWASDNYKVLLNWFGKVLDNETMILNSEGSLTELSKVKYQTTTNIYKEGITLKGLKKFLTDFSRIYEKAPIEVALWKEYLMFAQIFGIAEKVAKDFKDIYPEVIPDDYMNDFNFIYFVSYTGIDSANAAKSYNSGGGGFASGGGGSGSFGGGGSGGGGGR